MMKYVIVNAIKANEKRMEKLNSISDIWLRREKARNYVVAECQKLHYRATPDEVVGMVVMILAR